MDTDRSLPSPSPDPWVLKNTHHRIAKFSAEPRDLVVVRAIAPHSPDLKKLEIEEWRVKGDALYLVDYNSSIELVIARTMTV